MQCPRPKVSIDFTYGVSHFNEVQRDRVRGIRIACDKLDWVHYSPRSAIFDLKAAREIQCCPSKRRLYRLSQVHRRYQHPPALL